MSRLPFMVTYAGITAKCALHVDAKLVVRNIEFVSMNTLAMNEAPAAKQMLEKIEFINDLLHADVPFECLMSCRRSPGMFGAILDPAASEFENLKHALAESGSAA